MLCFRFHSPVQILLVLLASYAFCKDPKHFSEENFVVNDSSANIKKIRNNQLYGIAPHPCKPRLFSLRGYTLGGMKHS